MEVPHKLGGSLQVLSRFRGRIWITYPLDSVIQARLAPAAAFPVRVNDFFNLELLNALNFYGRRGRLTLSR